MANLPHLYGFDFPDDLIRLWDLARRVRPLEPLRAFEDTLHLQLVGPFDVLAGKFDRHTTRYPVAQHWRYPDDPPELFTVLVGEDGLHWGYWLDAPGASRPCVVAAYADQGFEPDRYGDDLVTAVRLHLEELASEGADDLGPLLDLLGTGGGRIGKKTRRDAGVIAPTTDGLGIVAPATTYRPLSLHDRALAERVWEEEPPRDLIDEATQACIGGHPATALKLGRELWMAHRAAACRLLDAAYAALGRPVLQAILADQQKYGDREWLDILEQEAHDRAADA
jgi:hypothetical protein